MSPPHLCQHRCLLQCGEDLIVERQKELTAGCTTCPVERTMKLQEVYISGLATSRQDAIIAVKVFDASKVQVVVTENSMVVDSESFVNEGLVVKRDEGVGSSRSIE